LRRLLVDRQRHQIGDGIEGGQSLGANLGGAGRQHAGVELGERDDGCGDFVGYQ
jgi:hypothetical protein